MIPESNGGGLVFKSNNAELRRSAANASVAAVENVLVSVVPSGALGSPSHPFSDIDDDEPRWICFCNEKQAKSIVIKIYCMSKQNKQANKQT